MGLVGGLNPRKLAETGWAVIFAAGADPKIRDALTELLDWRRAEAMTLKSALYREYAGADGYRPGESKNTFLARHGTSPGPADPERMPYYLLLVGGFEAIPYHVQAQFDMHYAVGRVHFDTVDEYARYARSVVAAERGGTQQRRGTVIFGVQHPDDPHTARLSRTFVAPLVGELAQSAPETPISLVTGPEATKARLLDVLSQQDGPGLLIASGHGLVFPVDHPERRHRQGALLCADWPGPQVWRNPIPPQFFVSVDDIGPSLRLQGMIAALYTSYSAATLDVGSDPLVRAWGQPQEPLHAPFVSALGQRLLAHESGGALAVIGMADQMSDKIADQSILLGSVARRILSGFPVGFALEAINEHYAMLSSVLTNELEDIKFGFGMEADERLLADLWISSSEAHNTMLLGDPAVRLSM